MFGFGGFLSLWATPSSHPVVMNDQNFVLKPMVTTGDPPWLKIPLFAKKESFGTKRQHFSKRYRRPQGRTCQPGQNGKVPLWHLAKKCIYFLNATTLTFHFPRLQMLFSSPHHFRYFFWSFESKLGGSNGNYPLVVSCDKHVSLVWISLWSAGSSSQVTAKLCQTGCVT